jgi:hypothetical protein
MQTEFARLHRSNAEMREAVNATEARAKGEAGFRRRAEQGWLAAQQSLERTQAELHQSRVQAGELEGRLVAADAVGADLEGAKKTITALQGKAAADDARLLELLESQKLNSQHVAVAMGHAQQHAASEYERLQAEHAASHQATASQSQWWRQRAERSSSRCSAAAAALAAARSSLESLLSRLVTATSVADMADQSRLLFEVKAALIDIEERLRRPDSANGGPPADAKGGSKGGGGVRKLGGGGGGGGASLAPPPPMGLGGPPLGIGQSISSSTPALHLPGIGAPFATAMGGGLGGGGLLSSLGGGFGGYGGVGGVGGAGVGGFGGMRSELTTLGGGGGGGGDHSTSGGAGPTGAPPLSKSAAGRLQPPSKIRGPPPKGGAPGRGTKAGTNPKRGAPARNNPGQGARGVSFT